MKHTYLHLECVENPTQNYIATVSKHNITSSISSSPFINLPDVNGNCIVFQYPPGFFFYFLSQMSNFDISAEEEMSHFACGEKRALLLHFFGFAAITICNFIFIKKCNILSLKIGFNRPQLHKQRAFSVELEVWKGKVQ